MTDIATLQQRLVEAEAAKHALLTGKQRVSIGYGDKSVSFERSDLAKLEAYIVELRAQLGQSRRRPLRVTF